MALDIVALVSVIGITLSGVLTTLFTSRCKHITFCWGCIDCERRLKDDTNTEEEEKNVVIAKEVQNNI